MMTTFTTDDREEAYRQKLAEAPYHPGYEDAVFIPPHLYKGMDPSKMIWKAKPLTDEEIKGIRMQTEGDIIAFARAIERAHGIGK